MPAIYIFVYYRAGLYADFGINICYLLAAVYGWIAWIWDAGQESKAEPPITYAPPKRYPPLTVVFLAAFLGIARILIRFTDSNVPWLDSFTTVLNIIGIWMLARKHVK